jgi:hypothetical protein
MKREYVGWIVAGAVVVMFCTLGAMQQADGPVGKYQMVSGVYVESAVTGEGLLVKERPTMILLDTTTGKAWKLGSIIVGGDETMMFSPVKDWWKTP